MRPPNALFCRLRPTLEESKTVTIRVTMLTKALFHSTPIRTNKESPGCKKKQQQKKNQRPRALLWGVQVWGPLRLRREAARWCLCVMASSGDAAVVPFTDQHSYLCSISRLSAHINIPQSTALWCFDHCVYSEKSGKYVNFKTKRTGMYNGLSGWAHEVDVVGEIFLYKYVILSLFFFFYKKFQSCAPYYLFS